MKITSPRFLSFIPFIFTWEGGYDNDPNDPGGETKFGIDKRSHPEEDIKNLTKDRAAEIYYESYWVKFQCEYLPKYVGEVVMNISVNAGPARAARWLQETVGAKVDGDIGPVTLDVVKGFESFRVAQVLLDRTEEHYRSIARGRLARFLKGWLNRNNALRKFLKIDF